jgi:hypothetical protein
MSPETSSPSVRPGDVTLVEIDDLLEEVARLARTESSPQAFHLEVLDRAVRALAAVGGAVWIRPAGGAWQIDSRVDMGRDRLVESLAEHSAHRDLLDSVSRGDQTRIVLPRASAVNGPSPNPTDFLLLLSPLAPAEDGLGAGVLEVAQRPGASPAAQQGYLQLLGALCELAADFHRQRRLRLLQGMAERTQLAEQFTLAVHASLDPAATACAVANEGRRLIECDRVSVAVRRGGAFRLLSVSGLETLDRRANIVRRLEELTAAVVAAGEPFWYDGIAAPLAPQIAVPMQAWQDESHARALAIIPLHTGPVGDTGSESAPPGAALIAERFAGGATDEACRQRVAVVCRHAELALRNALTHENLPFFRLLQALHRARWFVAARRLPTTAAVAAAALAALLALVFVPADLEVEARGVLQPRNRRDVFARSDGIVAEVRTEHARECREGEVLLVMSRSQLDFETSRVLGEMQTARKRLASVQAARLDVTPQTAVDREKYNQLTAEEEEVQELLKSLQQQHDVLQAQRDDLLVKSPLTGQVMTWNVRQSLESRPVQRGQMLLQVADLNGPWVLEAEIPDDRVGHVLAARQALQRDLPVSFMVATEPGAVYRGAIEKVALATDVRPPEKASVLVTVAIDREQVPQLRPNATVVSRIYCGRRSIGFVWFHSFWEMIQKKVLF